MKQIASLGATLILLLAGCSSAQAAARYQAADGSPSVEPLRWAFGSEPTDAISVVGTITVTE